MKIIALRTYSLSCDPIIEPLTALGHDVQQVTFFTPHQPFDHRTIPGICRDADFVFMLGQHDDGGGHVPPVDVLREVSDRVPTLHICCDGSEVVWWPQLESYYVEAPRMNHVNIDGVASGFFENPSEVRWTTLCPLDPAPFEKYHVPWNSRDIALGFCGGWGERHPRGDRMEGKGEPGLLGKGYLYGTKRPYPTYDGFREFMGRCRGGFNHAHTGTADHMHVKARVLETAYAGAVLVEPRGSPTERYFEPDLFLSWEVDAEVLWARQQMESGDSRYAEMASRFRARAIELYSARRFWERAFESMGL